MAESEEELKSILMREREESEKAGLKLNIEKTKIMAPGLNTLGQIEREKVEEETDFIFLDSKFTVDGATMTLIDACSLEGKLWQT